MAGVKGRSGKKLGVVTEILTVRVETPVMTVWNSLCAQEEAAGVKFPARPLLAEAIALLAQRRGVPDTVKEGVGANVNH